MVGRDDAVPSWFSALKMYDIIGQESFDYSRPNFSLSKAIYYASVIKDATGADIGQKYALGAVFGKPIINASAAFSFASPLSIVSSEDEENEAIEEVNDWFINNHSTVFDTVRYSMRDGVSYLRVKDDGTPMMISGERVEIKIDPITGEIIGYDVTVVVKEDDKNLSVKYRTEYRKKSPQIKIVKVQDGKETELETVERDGESGDYLDVISFHNEKEPSFVYGVSEFQNLYYLMSNYHAVMENAIKNNIFNSTAIPYIKGIDNVKDFLETHGERQDDGTYAFDWDAHKVLIGGKDFGINMMNGSQNAGEAQTLLNLLFWSICQTSETPEFVMGTAVSSSKASVSEQMPVMVRKAERKQRQYESYFRELAELVAIKLGVELPEDYAIVFPSIIDDDMKLNLEIVKVLSDEGLITDKTKALLLGLDSYVGNIDDEIELAKGEREEAEKRMARSIALGNQADDEAKIEE